MVQHQGEGCIIQPGGNRDVTNANDYGGIHYDQCAVSDNTDNNKKMSGQNLINSDDVDILDEDKDYENSKILRELSLC